MVNRILIRRKVVQMLYSYLLTRSEFKIEAAADTSSKDKKYAYSVYTDLIFLLIELSGIRLHRSDGSQTPRLDADKVLVKNRVGKALFDNDTVKEMILKNSAGVSAFDDLLQTLSDKLVKSAAYKDYKKIKSADLGDDVKFWITAFNAILAKDEEIIAVFRCNPDFTIAGFNAGMRLFTDTLTSYQDSQLTYVKAGNDLKKSLDKAYELYYGIFVLMMDITREQSLRLDSAKSKFLATHEDLNPDTRFVDNRLIAALRESDQLKEYLSQHPVKWDDEPALLKSLLDEILDSKIYRRYMQLEHTSFFDDCEFWRDILRYVIFTSDEFNEALESKSIYWNDDLNTMGTFVLKSLKQAAASDDGTIRFLPQYKDDEDRDFGPELFRLAVANREEYRAIIDRFINAEQWDPERIAFMDIVIIITALAELINFPSIPLEVTMNEYTEIANSYSSARSGKFVNGILYAASCYLTEQEVIAKNNL